MSRHGLGRLGAARRLAVGATVLAACASLGAVPTYAEAGDAAPTARRSTVDQSSKTVVRWDAQKRKPKKRVYRKTQTIPGVGNADLVCRPKATFIGLNANDRGAENQMWMAKFETKNGVDQVAVKNVRVYTYATAADDGTGGTGRSAHEGLNQGEHGIEDFQSGSAFGVISTRPGRNQDGGGAVGPHSTPVTAFKLTWWWERFAYPGFQFCKMKLVTRTDTARQFGTSWHGDDEALTKPDATRSTTDIAGLGRVHLTCETGRRGDHTLALEPEDPTTTWTYELIQAEGGVDTPDNYERVTGPAYDPVTGLLGPVPLPGNGMMRIWWSVQGTKHPYVLSSYISTNNARKPLLNVCEVAAAPLR